MCKKTLILFLGLALSSFAATAMEIEGVEIPDTLSLPNSDTTLVLNGAGLREKFFVDVYIGALYLESKTTEVKTIMNDTGAASVLMHFLHSEVGKDKLTAGWTEGFENNLSRTTMQAIEERITMFNKLFQTVHEGDVIRLDYLPDSGTQVRINGELRGTVEGNDFFRALLSIWLGERPVTKSLRKDMLGGE
jgi:Chalcone isomerase-like